MTVPHGTESETDREKLTREIRVRQKVRNIALGLFLGGLVVLFFLLTIVRFPTS